MALTVLYDEVTGLSDPTDGEGTSWVDTGIEISSGSMVANEKYLILLRYAYRMDDWNDHINFRFVRGATPTVFDSSQTKWECTSKSALSSHIWSTVYEVGGTAETIKLQMQDDEDSSPIKEFGQASLLVIRLTGEDLTENTDWAFDEEIADTSLTTSDSSGTNNAKITVTGGGEKWWIISNARIFDESASEQAICEIDRTGEVTETICETRQEGENSASSETTQHHTGMAIKTLTGSNTFEQISRSTYSGHERKSSFIFAINLEKFQQLNTFFNAAGTAVTENSSDFDPATTDSLTHNLSSESGATDNVILAYNIFDYGTSSDTNGYYAAHTMEIDSDTKPDLQEDLIGTSGNRPHDAADMWAYAEFTKISLSAASHTIDMNNVINNDAQSPEIEYRVIIAFKADVVPSSVPVTRSFTIRHDVLNEVKRSFTIRHDVAEQVTRAFTIRHDVLNEVTRQFTIRHDIHNEVTRQFTIRHDVAQQVTRAFQIRHDVLVIISRQFTLRHDILIEVTRAFTIRHDLIAAAVRAFTIRHDVAQQVTRGFAIRHDVLIEVTRAFTLRHDILVEVTRAFTIRHDIAVQVTRAFTLRHDVLQQVTRPFVIRHDVLIEVTRAFTVRHDVLIEVTRPFTIRHDVLVQVTRAFTIRNDILIEVTRGFTIRHDILVEVTRTFTIRHDVAAFAARQFTIRHDVLVEVTRGFTIRHDVLVIISRAFTIRHDVLVQVTRPFTIRWDVLVEVTRPFTIRHAVLIEVTRAFTIRHDILVEVSRQWNIRHDVLIEVTRAFTIRHDVLQEVTRAFTIRWDVLNTISRAFTIRHDVLVIATRQFTIRHDIFVQVTRGFTLRWDVIPVTQPAPTGGAGAGRTIPVTIADKFTWFLRLEILTPEMIQSSINTSIGVTEEFHTTINQSISVSEALEQIGIRLNISESEEYTAKIRTISHEGDFIARIAQKISEFETFTFVLKHDDFDAKDLLWLQALED